MEAREVSVGILTGEVVALVAIWNQILIALVSSCKPDRGSDKGYGFRCASE